jgi:hypothetical protein
MEAYVHGIRYSSVSHRLIRPNFVAEEGTMATNHPKDWRQLCAAVVEERDPERFLALVIELNDALDERERRRRDETLREEQEKQDEDRALAPPRLHLARKNPNSATWRALSQDSQQVIA